VLSLFTGNQSARGAAIPVRDDSDPYESYVGNVGWQSAVGRTSVVSLSRVSVRLRRKLGYHL